MKRHLRNLAIAGVSLGALSAPAFARRGAARAPKAETSDPGGVSGITTYRLITMVPGREIGLELRVSLGSR